PPPTSPLFPYTTLFRSEVLEVAKRRRPEVLTKSSLMLGLSESDAEIDETLVDLRAAGVDIVTLGQYLRPTVNHLPVERFVRPEEDRKSTRLNSSHVSIS